jgi:hypothetical protein
VIPRVPSIVVPGDSPNRLMARTPELRGVSLRRVAWRFGFRPGTVWAVTTGLSSPFALWVLAGYVGTVIELYTGEWTVEPPSRFLNCQAALLEGWHDRRDIGSLHPRPARVPEPAARSS